jgi:hypothetical protein
MTRLIPAEMAIVSQWAAFEPKNKKLAHEERVFFGL